MTNPTSNTVQSGAGATEGTDHAAIRQVLARYETALNHQDTETIVTLYADDGVFMPQHSLPQVGIAALRQAYEGVFTAITLDVRFTLDELQLIDPDWAFVRTRSEGTVTVNATGMSAPEGNQELFLFRRVDRGRWAIARYIFSTTNPPHA